MVTSSLTIINSRPVLRGFCPIPARKQEFQQRHPEVALPSTIQEDGADTYNVLDGGI